MSPQFFASSDLPADVDLAFAWHDRPGALLRLLPPWQRIHVIGCEGGIRDGGRTTLTISVGPLRTRYVAEHHGFVLNQKFEDRQLHGPFRAFDHVHHFEALGERNTRLEDRIQFRLPRLLSNAVATARFKRELSRQFDYRHRTTIADLEHLARYPRARSLRVGITGASGMVGRQLSALLSTAGHEVVRFVRAGAQQSSWLPGRAASWSVSDGVQNWDEAGPLDAVVHLAGENVGAGRWTAARRARIRDSRIEGTRALVSSLERGPRPAPALICASAIGYYGERGNRPMSEEAHAGSGFLAEVCRDWEQEAKRAEALGSRVVNLRFGVVLSASGGALGKMLPAFRAGLGGPLGSGRQYLSWISLCDAISAVHHLLHSGDVAGPVNLVAPSSSSQATFARTLGSVITRPTILTTPARPLRMVLGEMAEETLLASTRAVPDVLQRSGFRFRHDRLQTALRHTLGRSPRALRRQVA